MALKPHHERDRSLVVSKGDYTCIFGPRDFDIVWGSDARYWHLPKKDEEGPAELVKVSWLEVSTDFFIPSWMRGTKYEIIFSVSLKPDAFGWSGCPIYLMAKFGKKGKYNWRKIDELDQIGSFQVEIPTEKLEIDFPTTRGDDDGDDGRLYFGLYDVWTGIAKGGLLIHNATIKRVF